MFLTEEEERMLKGEEGPTKQKAMELLVGLGKVFDADRLIPISSVQVAGVSYKTISDGGLEWLEEMSEGRVVVPTTLNPAGMDLELWQRMNIPAEFVKKQLKIIGAFQKMGAQLTCSCTPYLLGNVPRFGEHIAWSESSAVCFANSVIGARTNREGGPSALASALIGKTPNYGLHLEENRRATLEVKVDARLDEESDYGALGYLIGKSSPAAVPYFTMMASPSIDDLKALGAALAASSNISLYHIEGITPEARLKKEKVEKILITGNDIQEAYRALSTVRSGKVDLVCFGCPHASLQEIKRIAEALKGKKVSPKTKLWVFTSIGIKYLSDRGGYTKVIEEAGGEIYCDCCMVVAPLEAMDFSTVVLNSAKAAIYTPTSAKVNVVFAKLKDCIRAAVEGVV